MTNNNFHIIIIEPSSVIYEGLNVLLGYSDDHFNVSRVGRIEEIPKIAIRKAIDIVIINPGIIQNNLKVYDAIRSSLPQTRWIGIVYSFFDQHLLSVFDDVINVYDSPESIISLVRRIADQHDENEPGHQQEKLSEREIDVLKLLTAGNSNKEIADKLNISTHTVISHRKNITQKTGIKSVSGLTIYAVVKNLINLEDFKE
jgi:DNA-binding NarL/FixJ family response regulator